MPISKKRKKKGKTIQGHGARIVVDPNKESNVTLQDLINALAYQEFMASPDVVIADDVKVEFADDIPVTITNEDGTKTRVGTATPIPGGDGQHVSVQINDSEILKMIQGPMGEFSIDKEHEDGR